MRSTFATFSVALILLTAIASMAQSDKSGSDGIVARLSYQSGGMGIDWRYQKGYPQICFAVYRSGYYRISRLTEQGNQTLEGLLSRNEFAEFTEVLNGIR